MIFYDAVGKYAEHTLSASSSLKEPITLLVVVEKKKKKKKQSAWRANFLFRFESPLPRLQYYVADWYTFNRGQREVFCFTQCVCCLIFSFANQKFVLYETNIF